MRRFMFLLQTVVLLSQYWLNAEGCADSPSGSGLSPGDLCSNWANKRCTEESGLTGSEALLLLSNCPASCVLCWRSGSQACTNNPSTSGLHPLDGCENWDGAACDETNGLTPSEKALLRTNCPVTCKTQCPDETAPTISCPANVNAVATSGAGAVVSWASPSATDNIQIYPISCSAASGSQFAVGVTQVECDTRDAAGNTASCRFSVTVAGVCTCSAVGLHDCLPLRVLG